MYNGSINITIHLRDSIHFESKTLSLFYFENNSFVLTVSHMTLIFGFQVH